MIKRRKATVATVHNEQATGGEDFMSSMPPDVQRIIAQSLGADDRRGAKVAKLEGRECLPNLRNPENPCAEAEPYSATCFQDCMKEFWIKKMERPRVTTPVDLQIPIDFPANREFMKKLWIIAVEKNGFVLEYADEELKKDRDIVLAAVKQHGYALQYADLLRKDREIVMAAVKNFGRALRFADPELKKDSGIVLAAVKSNAQALAYASEELKKDRDIVMAAVKQHWEAIEYADPELKKDREIVLAAVKQNGEALYWADPDPVLHREIVLALVQKDAYKGLNDAPEVLKDDLEIVLAAVSKDGTTLEIVSERLRADPKVVLAAVTQNGIAIMFAAPSLQNKLHIVQAALQAFPTEKIYISEAEHDQLKEELRTKLKELTSSIGPSAGGRSRAEIRRRRAHNAKR